jgi:hypothetical protein
MKPCDLTVAMLAAVLVLTPAAALAEEAPAGVAGEPAIPDDPPEDVPEAYRETPGAHSERPGKHSTTAGRHGTSGAVGGGIDAQSGSEAAPSDHPILDEREDEAEDAEILD